MQENGVKIPASDEVISITETDDQMKFYTRVFISIDNNFTGLIDLSDKIKENSKESIQKLKDRNIEIAIVRKDQPLSILSDAEVDALVTEIEKEKEAEEDKKGAASQAV